MKLSKVNTIICASLLAIGLTACSFISKDLKRSTAAETSNDLPSRPEFNLPDKALFVDHYTYAEKMAEWRFGIPINGLQSFFAVIHDQSKTRGPIDFGFQSEKCVEQLGSIASISTSERLHFINCLKNLGLKNFNVRLMHEIENKKSQLLKIADGNIESLRTADLLQWMEDIIRQNIKEEGYSSWFKFLNNEKTESTFTSGSRSDDFEFKDGDIVLSFGSTSISSLIPNATWPARRFAHAFIVKHKEKKLVTIESVIEEGVKTQNFKHYGDDEINNLVVLRWSDLDNRDEVATHAASVAYSLIGKPYNIAMDWNDESKFFCSQLVAFSYGKASNISAQKLSPKPSKIRSKALGKYLRNLGVVKEEMNSPGDFLASDKFTIVADYRRSENLMKGWEMLVWGDLYSSMIEAGYHVKVSKTVKFELDVIGVADRLYRELGGIGIIPDALTKEAIGVLKVQEQDIYKKALAWVENSAKAANRDWSVLEYSPWELYADMSWAFQVDPSIQTHLIK